MSDCEKVKEITKAVKITLFDEQGNVEEEVEGCAAIFVLIRSEELSLGPVGIKVDCASGAWGPFSNASIKNSLKVSLDTYQDILRDKNDPSFRILVDALKVMVEMHNASRFDYE